MNISNISLSRVLIACAILTAGAFFASASFNTTEPNPELAIGAKAPLADVKMTNIDGSALSLVDAAGTNGLLVVFSCNTCPFVVGNGTKSDGLEGRYNETAAKAAAYGFGMVLINSNEAKRDNHDSMEAMQSRAKDQGYSMPYLMDSEHTLADAFGAMKTPHVYLLDKDMKLIYRGALDDNVSDADAVESFYALDAMASTSMGKPCEVSETKAIGCSIKRVL
jgi:peroxiredoxin